ncbi:MAG: hypothetical protein ACOYYS_13090 [Chloroflexota bacterium]
MEIINLEKLQTLLQNEGKTCVSIYIPTHPVGEAQQQDPIRLKNMLAEASGRLEALDMRRPDIEALLSPAEGLLADSNFWQHQSDGLAVFVTPGFFETYRLPLQFDEFLHVGPKFYLKPVLQLLNGDGKFYLLALSQNQARLLVGDRFHIEEVELADTPTSLKEALRFDDPEPQLQFHTGTAGPGKTGERQAMFHGHGGIDDAAKNRLLRYFQKLDRGLMDLLNRDGERAPLVFAGVDYLFPIYQEANEYRYLVEEPLTGNPDDLRPAELHRHAWKLVEPFFQQALPQALERYRALQGAGNALAANRLEAIVPAAHHGQVEILFVARQKQVWGTYAQVRTAIDVHPEFQAGDVDLLDLAAIQTLLNGGKVYPLPPERMPEADVAAIYRFSYAD